MQGMPRQPLHAGEGRGFVRSRPTALASLSSHGPMQNSGMAK
ncbi:hypothetical protein GLA29479_2381 [Lysobacter antibioticus]|uniref:Uncharacterized protein n=1 Tax=Lysobacter antibioticus TaxID=84531 RepID=A0A0S2DXD8_LYSAN|nr:hypothetical protein GLA29479_2381 [Lysobacter antibioticus]ALN81475.1 hypothetical protein LA76x_3349 [Lysobacter antibioticus]